MRIQYMIKEIIELATARNFNIVDRNTTKSFGKVGV